MDWGKITPIGFGVNAVRMIAAAPMAAACLWAIPAQAGPVVSASGGARVVVVSRLSLVKTSDLSFGAVLPSAMAGTVVVSPSGTRTTTGGATAVGSTVSAAQFAGYGYNNEMLLISVNSNTPVLTRVGGTQTMTYDTFVIGSTPAVTLSTATQQFVLAASNGMFQFGLGATLRVKANQTPGKYTGSFSVTVNYL